MKKTLLLLLALAFSLLWAGASAYAQSEILLKVQKLADDGDDDEDNWDSTSLRADEFEQRISLEIVGEGEITFDGIKEPYSPSAFSYTATKSQVVIRGNVQKVACRYDQGGIVEVDITKAGSLKEFDCYSSYVKNIVAGGNKTIQILNVGLNALSKLDLTDCTALVELGASGMSSLKEVILKGCSSLPKVELQNSDVEILNLEGVTKLETLICRGSQLSSLNLTGCVNLKELDCSKTKLVELDVSGCLLLADLNANSIPGLTSLVLGNAKSLTTLSVKGGGLASIDLSGFSELKELYLDRNKLTSVNLEGCNNLDVVWLHLNKLNAEETTKICAQLPDRSAKEGPRQLRATGQMAGYNEANVWEKKDAAVAMRKNWQLMHYVDADMSCTPIYTFFKVTLGTPVNGTLAIENYTEEELKAVAEGTKLTIIATPAAGYKLAKVVAGDEDVTADMFVVVAEDITIVATFEQEEEEDYAFYLTSVGPSVATIPAPRYKYSYDENKRFFKRQQIAGNGTVELTQFIAYNEQGLISGIDAILVYDTDGKPSTFFRYTYDDQGKMINRKSSLWQTLVSDMYFIYDERGYLKAKNDELMGLSFRYTCNDNGQVITEECLLTSEEGTEPLLTKRATFDYNEAGQLVAVKKYNREKGVWKELAEELYEYVGEDLSKFTAINWVDGERQPVYEIRYEVDMNAGRIFYPLLPSEDMPAPYWEVIPQGLKNKRVKGAYYGLSSGTPNYAFDFIFTYEATPVYAEELARSGELRVNHASGLLTLEAAGMHSLAVYDAMGRQVRMIEVVPSDRIEMGTEYLAPGMYVVVVESATGQHTAKLWIK